MSNVNIGGGTYVDGNVSTGGKIVGRDEITNNYYGQPVSAGLLFVGVPAQPNHFVGRAELLEEIIQRLITGENPALSSEGLPGVGKTTLAIAVAHHPTIRQHFRDGVLWAGLGTQPDIMSALAQWAKGLGLDVAALADEASRAQAVSNAIGQRAVLIVIDDAWQLAPAQVLHVGGPNCQHLLTTRDRAIARAFAGAAQVKRVPTLAEGPAYELLQTLAPEACDADPRLSRALVDAVGGLPLALELLGGYLAAPEHGTFAELSQEAMAELSDARRRLQLASQRLGTRPDVQMTLQETIALSLADLPAATVDAFYALGAFAPKPDVFSLAAAKAVVNTDAQTLALLVSRNLVGQEQEGEGEWLWLHQTLADYARTSLQPDATMLHRDYYVALAKSVWPDWQQIEAAYGQIKHAWQAADDAGRVQVWQAVGRYQYRRGLWRDYIAWVGCAMPIQEAVGSQARLATTLSNIGLVYDSLGQRDTALDYYQRALPIREAVGDRAGESITRYNLAIVFRALGQLAEAVTELRHVFELDRQTQSPDLDSDQAVLARVEAELTTPSS